MFINRNIYSIHWQIHTGTHALHVSMWSREIKHWPLGKSYVFYWCHSGFTFKQHGSKVSAARLTRKLYFSIFNYQWNVLDHLHTSHSIWTTLMRDKRGAEALIWKLTFLFCLYITWNLTFFFWFSFPLVLTLQYSHTQHRDKPDQKHEKRLTTTEYFAGIWMNLLL